jgi:hypothetical protein
MFKENIILKLSDTVPKTTRVKIEKEKRKLAIRALRKARIYIRVMNIWGKTHNLPFETVCKFYTTGDEVKNINLALKALDFVDKDLPSSNDFDFDLGDLKDN